MYLSCIEIDTRHVRGRTWLANPYRIHQRLAMAFADGEAGRLLFRIESDRTPPRIIVQSPSFPDWGKAFQDHPVLAAPPLSKELTLRFHTGQRLRFLLRANPTARQASTVTSEPSARQPLGPRVGLLSAEKQRAWLERKAAAGGFKPLDFEVRCADTVTFPRGRTGSAQTHVRADFHGHLDVLDPSTFEGALANGIGAAKAFGFGLLSVAPG